MTAVTARKSIENWTTGLRDLFEQIESAALPAGWTATRSVIEAQEDPFSLGAPLTYECPVLTLRKADDRGIEKKVTFEPRHRFTIGAAGRIEVFSFPALREAMLLHLPDTTDAGELTWEQAELRVKTAPWQAFSADRLPLKVDFSAEESIRQFLEDLTR